MKKDKKAEKNKKEGFFKKLGPGLITGAADDDPSGIGTYSQTGAQFGFSQLWVAFFSIPFMSVIQEMCGRIGLVTGKGLATIVKKHYARPVLYGAVALLFFANTINIGADLGAMAASAQLIMGLPFWFWLIIITSGILILQILIPYPTYAKFLKYLTLSLFAYVATVFTLKLDWGSIAVSTFLPNISFSKAYLLNIVALLGTTISPYLFFWQTDEEVEEEIAQHKLSVGGVPRLAAGDIRKMRFDTVVGMILSNLIMFFIIITTAATLGANGINVVESADQAALALRPFAGDFAFILFAAGIIGTGLLAVPVLAGSASYALSESIGWKAGLGLRFRQARPFYVVIISATVIGALVNFLPVSPFQLLYYTAILNGLCAPPLMALILKIGNNKKIMGEHRNTAVSNVLGWIITGIMSAAGVALIITLLG